MSDEDQGGFLAYKHRVLFSMFRAVARIGIRLQVPIDQMESLFQMAYFREAREEQHLELGTIAELFGKSLRTVSSLHRRYRNGFFSPEDQVQLRRDLADVLARRARHKDEVVSSFNGYSAAELRAALDDLLREGRILRSGDIYRRNPEDHDFFAGTNFVGRVDGLNRQMDILAETVWQRLLTRGESGLARSYVFAASDEDLEALHADLLAFLRERAIAVDAAAQDQGVHNRRGLTIAAATLEEGS